MGDLHAMASWGWHNGLLMTTPTKAKAKGTDVLSLCGEGGSIFLMSNTYLYKMKDSDLITRIEHLIGKGNIAINKKILESYTNTYYIPQADYIGFKGAAMSFIENLYGKHSTYYDLFEQSVNDTYIPTMQSGISILESIKTEVLNGWLADIKSLVAAEVFSDFLEMSKYLLDEGFIHPAAVMIGSVLEEHLRQLCNSYKIDIVTPRGLDLVSKKADVLNADLKKANVYGPIEQKQVTAWLGIRNSAAHGKYEDYSKEQVDLMYLGVLDFISRIR